MTRRSLLLSAVIGAGRPPLQWIALNLASGVDSHHWDQSEMPVSMGSLLKPFLAIAYRATHAAWPVSHCAGSSSGCWFPDGHGSQNIVQALANSCNAYFLRLAAAVDRAALETTCLVYGLERSRRELSASNLIGLSEGWPQRPRNVVRSFARLAANASDKDVRIVLTGMARCAAGGTARAANFDCFAKTGTAPCSHRPRSEGDGFAIAIYPRDQPRRLLLVQHHAVTGAVAARDLRPIAASLPW